MDSISPTILKVFAGIGLLYLSAKAFSFFRLLTSLFILPGTSLSKFGRKGSWAVVTGASDGIGKEFATQLASRGFNLLLISRTASKLSALSSELKSASKDGSLQVKSFAMDFAENKDSDYDSLTQLINGLDIAILINNVGLSHSIPVPFLSTPADEMKNIITINCVGTLRITQLVAPTLVARKNGLILTMGSFGGLLPTPLLATYSGSKAFLQYWSTSLASELAPHGVTVSLIQSYLVTSAMSKIRRTSPTIPNPKMFVKSVLGKIGRSGGAQEWAYSSTPYWSHGVMQWGISTFVGVGSWVAVWANRGMHEGIRKRALRKVARDAKKQ
ncbi:NAD(P)-binding protein [Aulographum hederae CBS 113979]|uniref:Very-long-chain 3-oxoacyl-CoA reductase n=1 Tax=Aulographum hederae CBS 113979 TaxID=1176131 RepID=A0A6G1H2Z7_9PEZI|nr:NAD(P)-binding protein [Aulographum hederae CBS 113979]